MRITWCLCLLLSPQVAFAETLTSSRVLRPGTVIEAADLAVAPATVPGAFAPQEDITGLEARTTLYPGRPIRPGDVGPAALVARNQPVEVIYQTGGLRITTEGRSLSRGAVGDVVRVMNIASRTTVTGRVLSDGRVIVSPSGVSQ